MKNPRFYEYAEVQSVPRLRVRVLSTMLVLAAFAGFFWLAWYAYKSGTSTGQVEEVPVVEADEAPFRTAPDDPGGMEVPHRDKTIYETLNRNDGEAEKKEKLSPTPEEPVAPQVTVNEEALSKERAAMIQQAETPSSAREVLQKQEEPKARAEDKPAAVMAEKPEPAKVEKKSEPEKVEPSPVSEIAKPEPKIVEKEKPAVAKEKPTKPAAKANGVRAQLAAFKTSDEAEQAWKKIVSRNQSVLGKAEHAVERADIPGKGIFYRLQVVNVGGADDVRSLCKKLEANKQGCFLVK